VPGVPQRDRRTKEDDAADRRWFLVVVIIFVASVALLLGAHALYRATGPHPEVMLLLRELKHAVTHAIHRRPHG
jgi:hypothetical protein